MKDEHKILLRVSQSEAEAIKLAALKDSRSVNQWIRLQLAKILKEG